MNKTTFAVSFVSSIVKAALAKNAAGLSFSATCCKAIADFNVACPIGDSDRAAQLAVIFGNGEKGEKHDAGTLARDLKTAIVKAYKAAHPMEKGADVDAYESGVSDYVKVQTQRVRIDLSMIRKVLEESGNPLVVAALSQGLRASYNVAKPKAPKAETPKAPEVKPEAQSTYSRAFMTALVAEHFDDALDAVKDYLVRAADPAGLARLGELEIHLASKTKTTKAA